MKIYDMTISNLLMISLSLLQGLQNKYNLPFIRWTLIYSDKGCDYRVIYAGNL